MIEVTLTISKRYVYDELSKSSAYIGAKKITPEDEGSYSRIAIVDTQREMLERWWSEACVSAAETFKPFIKSVSGSEPEREAQRMDIAPDADFSVTLWMTSSFDKNLSGAMQASLFSYFVNYILSQWCKLVLPGEADGYASIAVGNLSDIVSKMYYKRPPTRPEVNTGNSN